MPDQRSMADLLRLGSAPREDALLQAQMQQAAALAQPRNRVYGTAGGAIMGGLSDALRGMAGGFRQNDLIRQAKEAETGRVGARQQWLSPAYGGGATRDQAGMAAALRRQAVADDIAGATAQPPSAPRPDMLTSLAPYQPGPILGGGGVGAPGTPAAPLAPIGIPSPAGQVGGSAPIGMGGSMASAPVAPLATPTGKPLAMGDPLRAKVSAPAVAQPSPQATEMPDLSLEQRAEIAIASGDPQMQAWGKTVLEQANLRAEMDAKQRALDAAAKSKANEDKSKTDTDLRDFAAQQRDRFEKLPEWREAQTARTALDIIEREGARGTAFGDMSMIYALVTGYDPKSGVKEGEFNAAAAAQGIPDRVINAFYQAKSGVKLGPDQRSDMIESARNSFRARSAPALQRYQEYIGYLDQAGLGEPEKYLPDVKRFAVLPRPPKAVPSVMLGKDGVRYVRQTNGTYLPED